MVRVVVRLITYQSQLMPKDDHIIDWIIERTSYRSQNNHFNSKKRANNYENRKVKLDNQIFLCTKCNQTWTKVPKNIDTRGWRIYPKGNIPTIGKARKICLNCDGKKE